MVLGAERPECLRTSKGFTDEKKLRSLAEEDSAKKVARRGTSLFMTTDKSPPDRRRNQLMREASYRKVGVMADVHKDAPRHARRGSPTGSLINRMTELRPLILSFN
jgi:hypothetical protein